MRTLPPRPLAVVCRRIVRGAVCLFCACIALSCRRSATEAGPKTAPRRVAVESSDTEKRTAAKPGVRRVIWVGLDAADWDFLGALAAEGKLPNWKRLSEEGFGARLASFEPMLSPILWTTQETGVGPDVHRVLDFQELDPDTSTLAPVSERSRKSPALWNLLSARGGKVGVVGFWATHPAEVVDGFFLSNRIDARTAADVPAGVGSPPSLDDAVRQIVGRDRVVTAEELAPYLNLPPVEIERAVEKNLGYSDPVTALADILGTTRVTQRLSRELYDRELPALLAVYFEGTDSVGHLFGRFAPPKLSCVTDAEFSAFSRVPETYFSAIDRILGQWMRRAREDGAILVVTSDHGFRWGADRPCDRSGTEEATAAAWHRSPGVFLAWGAAVQKSSRPEAATQFDVAPTLLALLGAPVDRRMHGRILPVTGGLDAPRQDVLSRLAVATVPSTRLDGRIANEDARKLAALGYISPGGGAPAGQPVRSAAGLTRGAWNNLGVYLRFTAHDENGAREAWKQALALDPNSVSALLNLARLERDRGDLKSAARLVLRAAGTGMPNPESAIGSWAADFQKTDAAAAIALLREAHAAHPENEAYTRDLALALGRANRCSEAVAVAVALETSTHPESLNAAASVEVCLDRPDRVRDLLSRSLVIDPNQPRVRDALESLPR